MYTPKVGDILEIDPHANGERYIVNVVGILCSGYPDRHPNHLKVKILASKTKFFQHKIGSVHSWYLDDHIKKLPEVTNTRLWRLINGV